METLTVRDASRRCGLPAATIRYYSRRGLISPRQDPTNGYHRFSEADFRRLRFIRRAQRLGFSLREIQTIIEARESGVEVCRLSREYLARNVESGRQKLARLEELQARMERALAHWSVVPDPPLSSTAICPLIEQTSEAE
jgi:DNA-binding transcriptional MerR regulator